MAKLFVIDLDKTLLNSNHEISEKNLFGLKLLKSNGYDVAFCSGRVLESVRKIGLKSSINPYHIANNGAIISVDQKIIYEKPLAYDKLKLIVDLALKKGYGFHMYDKDTYYSNAYVKDRLKHLRDEKSDEYQIKVICQEDIMDYIIGNEIAIYKIMLHMNFSKDIQLRKYLDKLGGLYLSMSGDNSSDIMSQGVSKGEAVKRLISFLDKDYKKIVCIGDHENDISMIEIADIGIAMANGVEEIKKKSDWITKSNDEDGFYYAVKYVLEGEK